jgi:AcrR family transcriptional regulator
MPRVTQQHRDERREQILAAGRRCFLRDGFHGTSMQDLFAEAGLSSGAVYGYFASKDEVIVAIAEENMQEVVAMIHLVATKQPDQSIGATVAGIFEIVRTKHAHDGLGGIALLVWAEALRNSALRDRLTALLAQLRADLTKAVRDHQRAGDITREVKADAVAGLLISTVPGYIVQLALIGPGAVSKVPDAALALWPCAS